MTTDETQQLDNWKQFQGTELGSLMSQIYGSKRNTIIYPKVKVKQFNPTEKYIPFQSSTKVIKKDVNVKVPKLTGRKNSENDIIPQNCPINLIPRRKHQDVIEKELDVIRFKQSHYRPAHTKAISSDHEKERLSQICEYKGGKILPAELVNVVSDAPFEIMAKKKELERIEAAKLKRGISTRKTSQQSVLSETEQLAEQISREIEERRQYINEMKSLNALSRHDETRILMEISTRVNELKTIDG